MFKILIDKTICQLYNEFVSMSVHYDVIASGYVPIKQAKGGLGVDLVEFRCSQCNKLLGRISGQAEIKCPRCNKLNIAMKRLAKTAPERIRITETRTGRTAITV